MNREIKEYHKKEKIEEVEAEIVTDEGNTQADLKNLNKPLLKFKITVSIILFFLGFFLAACGILLTSTIIGAFIGIPLTILGGALIWCGLKIIFSKSNTFIFKTFRF